MSAQGEAVTHLVDELIGLIDSGEDADERLARINAHLRASILMPERDVARHVLHVRMFGVFALRSGTAWESGPAPKNGGELIQYLATYPKSVVSRDDLATKFWPDTRPEDVVHRLHLAASGARAALRRHLDGYDAIRCTGGGYAWRDAVEIDSDLARFLACYQRGTLESYRASTDIYQGEFLAGENAEWVQPMRVRCSAIYIDLLEHLAVDSFDNGKYSQALQYALLVVAADRGHEGASRLVMRCFAALGRRSCVVDEYETLRHFLRRHLEVEPTAETRHLFYDLIGTSQSAS